MSAVALPKAVLWDMDGTLVDTEPYWIECEFEVVSQHGNGNWSVAHGHALVGRELRDSARYIQQHGEVQLEIDDIVNFLLDGVIERVQHHVPWQPGARELLAHLNELAVPCALVTASWRRFAMAVVEALPSGSFAVVVTGDEVVNGKPHPEPYLTAAAWLGVQSHECVALEDSPNGLRSAVAAGCMVVAIPHLVELPDDPSYRRVPSLTGMTAHGLIAS
jgi:HAD superfamily hydrolase (TIGR01509 family)